MALNLPGNMVNYDKLQLKLKTVVLFSYGIKLA